MKKVKVGFFDLVTGRSEAYLLAAKGRALGRNADNQNTKGGGAVLGERPRGLPGSACRRWWC